jgi:G:T-mismatch repair DNA endonuclease (very short patch repair protein)
MPVHKPFRMRILKSTKILKTERRPTTVERIREKPTTAEIVIAFKGCNGLKHRCSGKTFGTEPDVVTRNIAAAKTWTYL